MRIVIYIVGIFWTACGIVFSLAIFSGKVGVWLASGTAISALIAGFVLSLAGFKNYRGDWPFILGCSYFVITTFIIFNEVDHVLSGITIGLGFAVPVSLFLLFSSFVLLFSGHKLHRYVVELDSIHLASPASADY